MANIKTPKIRQRAFVEMVLPGHLDLMDAYMETSKNSAKKIYLQGSFLTAKLRWALKWRL